MQLRNFDINLQKKRLAAGEVTQQLRALTALAENLGWFLSTHKVTNNYPHFHFQGIRTPSSDLHGYCMTQVHLHTCRQYTHKIKIINEIKRKKDYSFYAYGCYPYICLYTGLVPTEAKKGCQVPHSGVTDCCEQSCGYWELNLGPPQDHIFFFWSF